MPKKPYVKKSVRAFAETLRPILLEVAVVSFTISREFSVSRMVARLNDMGITGPSGGKWHPAMLARVISRLPGFAAEVSVEKKKRRDEQAKQNPAFSKHLSASLIDADAAFDGMNK